LRITGELAGMAEATVTDATRVAANARRHVARQGDEASGRLRWMVAELDTVLDRTARVIAQTRTRLGGQTPASSTRLVSMHDPDARPIAKGRLGKPVEFGYKAQVVDNADGIVLDHSVHRGNPADAPLLAPALARIKALLGRAPRAVTADRGYGEAKVEDDLTELGVKTVVIPRKGKPSTERLATEHGRGFRRLVKWRTGSEGRIAFLKRRYGFDRTLLDGLPGTMTWCGMGVLTHNTVKIAALVQAAATTTCTGPVATPTDPRPRPGASARPATGSRAGPRKPVTARPLKAIPALPLPDRRACGTSQPGGTPAGSRKSRGRAEKRGNLDRRPAGAAACTHRLFRDEVATLARLRNRHGVSLLVWTCS
jgi:IS5 family transposase